MKKHLLFLGAPGAGKGTQAEILSQTNSYLHLSTGELLRKEIEMNTSLGKQVKSIINKGGFVRCGWDGNSETEAKIKKDTKATIRCIPFDEDPEELTCVLTGQQAKHEVIFAKAY